MIWSGYGRLAGIIFLAAVGIMFLFGLEDTYAFLFGSLIAAPVIWIVGRNMNRPEERFDYRTKQKIIYKPNHHMFGIPLQYWALIYLVGSVIYFIS